MKIGIISANSLFRRALVSMLSGDLRVEWETSKANGQGQAAVDVIVVDAPGDKLDGTAIEQLKCEHREAKIAVLYKNPSEELIVQTLLAGVQGCLSMQQEADVFVAALQALARGQAWAGRRSMASALERACDRNQSARPAQDVVSRREWEVLNLVAAGKSNKEIAAALYISVQTVKRHLYSVFRKLHVSSRLEAGLKFYQLKMA